MMNRETEGTETNLKHQDMNETLIPYKFIQIYTNLYILKNPASLENTRFTGFSLPERAGIRTPDNLIKSQVLYRLSYTPICLGPESNQ